MAGSRRSRSRVLRDQASRRSDREIDKIVKMINVASQITSRAQRRDRSAGQESTAGDCCRRGRVRNLAGETKTTNHIEQVIDAIRSTAKTASSILSAASRSVRSRSVTGQSGLERDHRRDDSRDRSIAEIAKATEDQAGTANRWCRPW